jgi:hypothetical protein
MKKSRVLSALVSIYTALWFALDGAWFFKWSAAAVVLSILVVSLAASTVFFMRRTRHALLLSVAEFSWILFNVAWIRYDMAGVQWCQTVAICFLVSGLVSLAAAFALRTMSRVPQPFDNVIFRRLKI